MRIIASILTVGSLLAASLQAQTTTYHVGPDRGGRLNVLLDGNIYQCGSTPCVKVIDVQGTHFTGLEPGDFILMVNAVRFSTFAQFRALVSENSPNAVVQLDYLDASENGTHYSQRAALQGTQVPHPAMAQPPEQGPSLATIAETIVRADAKHWRAYTYQSGSMRDVKVTHMSPNGRDFIARGSYLYNGLITTDNTGWVELHFRENQFSCMRYWDDSACRPALTEDRSFWGPVLTAAAVAGAVIIASGGSSAESSSTEGNRAEQLRRCDSLGDPNPAIEAAMIDQCRRNVR